MPSLLSMKIENFRSFYSPQVLEFGKERARDITALFGPNSGGKSNTAKAMYVMFYMIANSSRADWGLPFEPFLLRVGSNEEPTVFEIAFEHSGREMIYSFSYDRNQIKREELREKSPKINRYKTVFLRDSAESINTTAEKFGFSKTLMKKTRPDTLLITKAREDNNHYANLVFDLINSVSVILTEGDDPNQQYAELLKENPSLQDRAIELLRKCDFSIHGIELSDAEAPPREFLDALPFTEELKQTLAQIKGTEFKTHHVVRDAEQSVVDTTTFDFWSQESYGTKKFFEAIVPIMYALDTGGTVYFDEFGNSLHPLLIKEILSLFRNQAGDNRAHLIFNTQNTSVMQEGLRREEIILVDKNLAEESIITPLMKRGVRKEEAFEKRYREGMYGAIPRIREREALLN